MGLLVRTTLRAIPLNCALALETVSMFMKQVIRVTKKWSSILTNFVASSLSSGFGLLHNRCPQRASTVIVRAVADTS